MSKNVFVLNHPLSGSYLSVLRDKDTSAEQFRLQAARLTTLLTIQATADLETKSQSVETAMCETTQQTVQSKIGVVPILRAGMGMVDPFLALVPQAHVLALGLYRDEQTHEPVAYYNKLTDSAMVDHVYIVDPMLATGGSAIMTIEALKEWGATRIKFLGLIGVPEGVAAVHEKFPEIDIHLAALDECLNEDAYIIPGLGDAGDRLFNS